MRNRRLVILTAGLALVAMLAAIALFVKRPSLITYSSPPFDSLGQHAKFLVPAGWQLDGRESALPRGSLSKYDRVTLIFRPGTLGIPRWLRRLLRLQDPAGSMIFVDAGRSPDILGFPNNPADGRIRVWGRDPWLGMKFVSVRVTKAGNPAIYAVIGMVSADRATFDTWHTPVCSSLQIEQ